QNGNVWVLAQDGIRIIGGTVINDNNLRAILQYAVQNALKCLAVVVGRYHNGNPQAFHFFRYRLLLKHAIFYSANFERSSAVNTFGCPTWRLINVFTALFSDAKLLKILCLSSAIFILYFKTLGECSCIAKRTKRISTFWGEDFTAFSNVWI